MIRATGFDQINREMFATRFVDGACSIDVKLARQPFSETVTISFHPQRAGRISCTCADFRMNAWHKNVKEPRVYDAEQLCLHAKWVKSKLSAQAAISCNASDMAPESAGARAFAPRRAA